jgi:hypothetical protein
MSKKSNDSIEEFFKKGVRKSDITFRESDWQKMERMLDERAMVGSASASRPLKRIIGVVVIVALLSSIYFLIPNGNEERSLNQEELVVANKDKNQVDQSSKDQTQSTVHNKTEDATQSPVKSQDAIATQKQTGTSNEQSLTKATKSGVAIETVEQESLRSNRNDRRSDRQQIRTDQSASTNQVDADKTTSRKINDGKTVARNSSDTTNGSLSGTTVNHDDDIQQNSVSGQSENTAVIVSSGETKQTQNSAPSSRQELTPSTSERSVRVEQPQASNLASEKSSVSDQSKNTAVIVSSGETKQTQHSAPSSSQELTPTSSERSVPVEQPQASDFASEKSSVKVSSGNKIQHDDSSTQKDSAEIVIREEKVVDPTTSESKTDDNDKDETITPSRWSVAFVVAPEFSSTSLDKQTVPGSAYGLTIGYRVADRLTISTGVIKTYKKYVGYGKDYQPPAGYWEYKTNGVVPDEVSGQCSVIEVPLILQYDLIQRERSRLFAAAGASSYRMLNEKYDYTFNEPNDGAANGWSTTSPSTYYFSVGHLSLGYDYRLYRGLHVGIEPYVKIPFGGIGWSNVDLLTMGAYVNVRYRFLKRN